MIALWDILTVSYISVSGVGNQMPFKDGECPHGISIGKAALWLRYESNSVPLIFVQMSQSA